MPRFEVKFSVTTQYAMTVPAVDEVSAARSAAYKFRAGDHRTLITGNTVTTVDKVIHIEQKSKKA